MDELQFSYELLLDHLKDGVCVVDSDQRITVWNTGAERITGFEKNAMAGKRATPDLLAHLDKHGKPHFGPIDPLADCLKQGDTREAELYLRRRDGGLAPVFTRISPILNPRGEAIGAIAVFSDNSSKVEALERIEALEEIALVCPTTGVGNRRYAEMALLNAHEELLRYQWPFGVLFVDIDYFKQVNDQYGHAVGDEILRMVALAMRDSLRSFDFVGRWGGEEFVVVLPNITDDILKHVAERCRRSVEESEYHSEGRQIRVTISAGAVLADPAETIEACISRADRLMYQSKAEGRNRVTSDC